MKKIKQLLIATVFMASFTACDTQMAEMNTDPLALAELPDEYLFTTAIHQTFGNGTYLHSFHMRFASQYAHIYVTNSEMRSADGYQDFHTQDIYKEMFETLYIGPLRYINEVLMLTADGKMKNPVRYAIAEIVAVINYAQATDSWGDVPYTEGAHGSNGVLYPKYDKQEFIYHDMMNKLKSSIAVLKTANSADGYAGSDPVYNNDLSKWVRFANSLRLRLAMRIRFVDPTNSAEIITECMAEPLIETNDQNFELKHQESEHGDLYNPWYDIRKYQNFKMSEKFTNWLSSTNDPRLNIFVSPNGTGEYNGVPNGLNDQAVSQIQWDVYSSPMPVLYSKSLSQYLMCASEVYFLRAEAALFKLAPGDANSLYRQGITVNMNRWNIGSGDISKYLESEVEAKLSGNDENKFRQISTQLWIAALPNFSEAWNNIRRTGYPEISQRTDATVYSLGVTNGYLPARFKYATSEYLNNKTNVTDAVNSQGKDLIDTRIWWDVREK